MAATLGTLVIQLAADTVKFQGDLGRAAEVAQESARDIEGSFSSSLGKVTALLAGVGGSLLEFFKKGTESAEAASILGDQIGLTAEQLSRLQYAATIADAPVDALNDGLKILAKNVGAAAGGNKEAINKFDSLGISIRDANGNIKDLNTIFDETIVRFNEFEKSPIKSADEIALLGRQAETLGTIFEEGADKIHGYEQEADKLGITISTKTAESARTFNDELAKLKSLVGVVARDTSGKLTPALKDLVDEIIEFVKDAKNVDDVTNNIVTGFKVMASAAIATAGALSLVGKVSGAAYASSAQFLQGNFSQGWSILKEGIADAGTTFEKTYAKIQKFWDDTTKKSEESAGEVDKSTKRIKAPVIPDLASQYDFTKDLDEVLTTLEKKTQSSFLNVYSSVDNTNKHFKDLHDNAIHLWDEMDQAAQQGAMGIQSDLEQFFIDPFKEGLSGLLQAFIKTIEQMLAKALAAQLLRAIFGGTDSGGSSGGLGNLFTSWLGGAASGARAAGGPVSAGSSYIVGENGPELFTPTHGGNIIPNGGGISGATSFNHTYYIDAKGADADRIQRIMPAMMEQTRAATKRDLLEAFRRAGLPAPRMA